MININPQELILLILSNLIFISSTFLLTKIFFKTKIKDIKRRLLLLIPLFIITLVSSLYLNYQYQILIYFITIFIIIKFIFKNNINDTLIIYLIESLIYFLTSYLLILILLILNQITNLDIYLIKNTYYEIIIVSLTSLLVSFLIKNMVSKLLHNLKNRTNYIIKILFIINVLELIIATYNLCIIKLNPLNLIISFIIPIIFLIISIFLIKLTINKLELTKKYHLLEEYFEVSSDLIEKYSTTIHKYKNNLITLKGYIKNNNGEALTYINTLLGDYKKKEYNWLIKINYIEEDSIRYLVYYKLSKAEESGLKIIVDINSNIKKINYNNLKLNEIGYLNDILGEYFDNAIYASLESTLKELNFMIYQEDNSLVFLISNTYKDEIDLSLIEKMGYTTKGKGHGIGLYEIAKSITNNDKFNCSYELLDNYFIAKLIVKIK